MANNNVDINKLKDIIQERKTNKEKISNDLGDGKIAPKNNFLHGLLEARNSGRSNHSTELLKVVNNKTAEKKGERLTHDNVNNNTIVDEIERYSKPSNNRNQSPPPVRNGSDERDHLLFEEIERRQKEIASGGVLNYKNQQSKNNNQGQVNEGVVLNEGKLNETINEIIKDKFSVIVEQAMKDSIVEMYAATRMEEVLKENKNFIKNVVIETIRELQQRKK